MDRETVITRLQVIHTWAEFAREYDLQFFTEKHLEDIAQWSDDAIELLKEQEAAYQGAVELLQQKTILFDDAIKRLKEQETNPVEPIEEIVNDVLLWHCGKCGFYLGPNDHFCSNCGRSVKWE